MRDDEQVRPLHLSQIPPSTAKLNEQERKVATALEAHGFKVLRNGWPDFLVIGRGRDRRWTAFALEVKTPGDKLSEAQRSMASALKRMGLPVYVTSSTLTDWERVWNRWEGRVLLRPEDMQRLQAQVGQASDRAARVIARTKALQEQVEHLEEELRAATSFQEIELE